MIYLGADHRGYELKEKLKLWFEESGVQYEDCGAFAYDKDDDYPDFAKAVGDKVAQDNSNPTLKDEYGANPHTGETSVGARGILICGSGIGMAIAANKIKGIMAGTALKPEQIASAEGDEGLNILSLSSDFATEEENKAIVKTFLESHFSGAERHVRRVNKIKELEN